MDYVYKVSWNGICIWNCDFYIDIYCIYGKKIKFFLDFNMIKLMWVFCLNFCKFFFLEYWESFLLKWNL